jgi:hypothetical protein
MLRSQNAMPIVPPHATMPAFNMHIPVDKAHNLDRLSQSSDHELVKESQTLIKSGAQKRLSSSHLKSLRRFLGKISLGAGSVSSAEHLPV